VFTNLSKILPILRETTQRCSYSSRRSWMKDLASGGDLYPELSCFSSFTFISITNSRTWDSNLRKSWWGSLTHSLQNKNRIIKQILSLIYHFSFGTEVNIHTTWMYTLTPYMLLTHFQCYHSFTTRISLNNTAHTDQCPYCPLSFIYFVWNERN
jgi:hypothetical protein